MRCCAARAAGACLARANGWPRLMRSPCTRPKPRSRCTGSGRSGRWSLASSRTSPSWTVARWMPNPSGSRTSGCWRQSSVGSPCSRLMTHPSGYDPVIIYDDRVMTSSFRSAVLRNGVVIGDPLGAVLGFVAARWDVGVSDLSRPASFGEPDLRLANRDGARISAAQIAAILERRRAIEQALQAIAPDASLAGAADSVPWLPLGQLFGAFTGIRGVGMSKMTKALYRKRPALIPILDSIVQRYLEDDDLGSQAPFGERVLGLVRGYGRDLG